MARPFTTKEVQRLLTEHNEIQKKLENIVDLEKKVQEDISETANRLVMLEVLAVLKEIPLEELNREKKELR